MDVVKVGQAIAYLRKRAGYTQKDLADRIGISDKAVSKWERGLSLPDIAYLGKLAILLDTDSDSLLAGDVIHHDKGWAGLLVLRKTPCGICAKTMIFDKPLVYILLSYFLLVGIRKILICCDVSDQEFLITEFGNGERLGIELTYCSKPLEQALASSKSLDCCCNIMLVFGNTFLYGVDQTRFFQRAMLNRNRVIVLSIPRKASTGTTPIYFDSDKKVVSVDTEFKIMTQYDYSEIPILFTPQACLVNVCDKLGLFSSPQKNEKSSPFYTEMLDRGYVEIDLNTWDDVAEASGFVRTVQRACGMNLYCVEEIAWRRGMIDLTVLEAFSQQKADTAYGQYLLTLCAHRQSEASSGKLPVG